MNYRDFRRQQGQSIVIVAVAMIVLLIFGAFAVDLSFAFFQRRSMQNAADAAALAGARALGEYQSDPNAPTMTDDELYLVIQEYAARNQAKYVDAYYTVTGGQRAGPITPGSGSAVPKSGVVGVEVDASTDFSTFFARVMGYSLLDAEAQAAAAYGAATSAKYVSPLAVHRDDAQVGELCVLYDKNQSTGNADTGWLMLTCRYPSHGSYCAPTNPELRDWTASGYGGMVRAPGQYSGDPSHEYWQNISALSPGDVVVVPVFDEVRHYTTYSKCDPDYVAIHGAYDCWENEIYGEILPVYTDDSSYEAFYYYDVESFAACEIHSVNGESASGEYVPFAVEGDWINPEDDGVFVVKLTDNKGAPTTVATSTNTPVPSCDANLALSLAPSDDLGCGPYVFDLTVQNTGMTGDAGDVIVNLEVIANQEWVQAVSPEVWNVGDLAPGEVASQQVIVTMVEDWPYNPSRGAEVGTQIELRARVVNEACQPDLNEGKSVISIGTKDENCEPATATPTATATFTPTPTNTPTPTSTPTPTPRTAGDIQGQVVACIPENVIQSRLECERVPVDVMHVVDTSWSMQWGWDGRGDEGEPRKIASARQALLTFNGFLEPNEEDPVWGDQAGVVSFDGTSATLRRSLTNDIDSVNSAVSSLQPGGWTPLVMGVERGAQALLSSGHVITHTPLLIIASDGLANVRRDGIRHPKAPYESYPDAGTYEYDCRAYYGSGDSYADCLENPGVGSYPNNHPIMYDPESSAQAIEAANAAKAAGIEVVTIAMGNDFDPSVLQAMASPDDNGIRHFIAATPSELEQIYEGLISNISHVVVEEVCRANWNSPAGAQVTITSDEYSATTTTDENGNFSFTDVPEGTYTFEVTAVIDEVVYDVLTDEPCGTPSTITLEVERGEIYEPTLWIANENPVCFPEPQLYLKFLDGTPDKEEGAEQPARLLVKVEDQFYHGVEGASVIMTEPNYIPMDELEFGEYIFEGGRYGDYPICWVVEATQFGYEKGVLTGYTDGDGEAPAAPTPIPPTNTPEPTTEEWVVDWSGTMGNDYAICEYEPQWLPASGSVTIVPEDAKAYLQTTWRVVQPQDPSICPPSVPNCLETQYFSELITGDTEFAIPAWWPGIRPTDEVVEIHYGANILDEDHNPIHDGIGLDLYWYPWFCPPPGESTPTPTATPNVGDHSIILVDVNESGGNTTFTYEVTSGTQPSISDWMLSLGDCIDEDDILATSEPFEWQNNDPHHHMRGIKFDNGYNDGETRTVWIQFRGQFGQGGRAFGLKAGLDILSGSVGGPVCETDECPTLEVEFEMPEPIDCFGGPHTMRLRVRNTAENSFAGDVVIDISALVGSEYIDSIVPATWNVGDIAPGHEVETQIQLQTNAAWGEAQQGRQIQLRAQVTHEECGGEGSVGRYGIGEMRRGQSCGGCEVSDAELVVAFDTDYMVGCGEEHTMTLRVTNMGQHAFAGDVEIDLSAIVGGNYVESIEPSTLVLGDIAAGHTVETQITLRTRAAWGGAAEGEEIRLRARVRHEQCGSDRTVGKYGDARLVRAQCGDGQETPTPTPTASPTPNMLGPHQIDFLGSTYSGENTTFTYQVTSGDAPAISHWVLDGCFGYEDVVGANEHYEYVTSDPSLQVPGVKFDQGYTDGESRIVQITLEGRYSEEGRLYEIGVKSGGDTHFGTVVGPGCFIEPTPEVEPFQVRVNVGGGAWTDPYGYDWSADEGASGGTLSSTNDPIAGTERDHMMQTYRYGNFTYQWNDVPNGSYTVRLFMIEPWWTAKNKRQFKVTINGQRVLYRYDIYNEVGHDSKSTMAFSVNVTNGTMRISFATQKDNAIVSGIWIDPR